jgi:hypothetical protein
MLLARLLLRASVPGALLAGTTMLWACHGCTTNPGDVIADGGAPSPDALPPYEGGISPCKPPPKPAGVPDGWELYNDYWPCCGLYTPSSPASLPAPIRWRSCDPAAMADAGVADGGIACRQMVVDWLVPAGQPEAFVDFKSWVQPNDAGVTVMVSRNTAEGFYRVFADVDGPARVALLETQPKTCVIGFQDLRDGKYVVRVLQFESGAGGGAIAGDLRELRPSVTSHTADSIYESNAVGLPGVLRETTAEFDLYPWGAADGGKIWSSKEDNGLQQTFPFFQGNALFWASGNLHIAKQKVWTDAGGVQDFISFGSDTTRGAGDLGTDGVDLVWAQGSNRTDPNGGFPTEAVMTAPYGVDPTTLVSRRVRSSASQALAGSPFTVGCGYAARWGGTPGGTVNDSEIVLVRLSDGRAWRFPSSVGAWRWVRPVAITCSEFFVAVRSSGQDSFARVRLDSLGPGSPAD